MNKSYEKAGPCNQGENLSTDIYLDDYSEQYVATVSFNHMTSLETKSVIDCGYENLQWVMNKLAL